MKWASAFGQTAIRMESTSGAQRLSMPGLKRLDPTRCLVYPDRWESFSTPG